MDVEGCRMISKGLKCNRSLTSLNLWSDNNENNNNSDEVITMKRD